MARDGIEPSPREKYHEPHLPSYHTTEKAVQAPVFGSCSQRASSKMSVACHAAGTSPPSDIATKKPARQSSGNSSAPLISKSSLHISDKISKQQTEINFGVWSIQLRQKNIKPNVKKK